MIEKIANHFRLILLVCVTLAGNNLVTQASEPRKPNILFILADDLGYGDLGCYGQQKIKTPNIDRLAAEGMLFSQCYAGSTVCAPSRCALMTGLHTGHCRTRGNGGGGTPRSNVPLGPQDPCVAESLKKAGYRTALIGKWGLGEENSTGIPTLKGFDYFFGYLNQHHAHNYYPDYLIKNDSRFPLPENIQRPGVDNVAEQCVTYTPDLMIKEALQFIDNNQSKPFFLYFATTIPHANNERTRADKQGNEIPSNKPYEKTDWPKPEKDKAAMITRLDQDVGKLLAQLKKCGLEKDTIVIFSSDNGPHREGGNDPAFFKSSGPLTGIKRALTDGGIRVPGIVRWPGKVKAGSRSDHVWAFWDFFPTACEIAGVQAPKSLDGVSFLPTLTGQGRQAQHEYLYWEFHEGGFKQAVRFGDWKAIKLHVEDPIQLYNLKNDLAEKNNVAAKHPEVVAQAEAFLKKARTESKEFPIKPGKRKK